MSIRMNRGITLVVIPQANEMEPLVEALARQGRSKRARPVGRLECVFFDDLALCIAVGGHGKTQLAVQTQHLIEHLPDASLILCAGAAGGLADHLTQGDIVVGTTTVEHDYKPRFVRRPPPRHQAHGPTVESLRATANEMAAEFRIHFGAIASGDEDIVDRGRAEEVRRETGALCVAWEGAGAARAAAFNGLPFVEIRVITDAADESAAMDFHESLAMVMPNLARLVSRWATAR